MRRWRGLYHFGCWLLLNMYCREVEMPVMLMLEAFMVERRLNIG